MVFPYLTSLFSKKKKDKIQSKPTIFNTFPELNQGQAYLRRRNEVQQAMGGHLNLIEGFANPACRQASSWCSSDCTPRYGYCPPTFGDLQYEKDDNPSQRQAQMNKFNTLNQNYSSSMGDYMKDVSNYITNPPTGLLGQNLVVPQLDGPAPWGPGNEPPPPPSPVCPPNTCITYNGSKYRTLTGYDPNSTAWGCEMTTTGAVPRGWTVAPADDESKKVVGMYNWGTAVVVLADGHAYNTKNYGSPGGLFGGYPWPQYTWGIKLDTNNPQLQQLSPMCEMAILLKKPPPAAG